MVFGLSSTLHIGNHLRRRWIPAFAGMTGLAKVLVGRGCSSHTPVTNMRVT